jgi:hypothetical protein
MQSAGEAAKSQDIEALARFVARFHRTGFVHRDLYLSHVFLAAGRGGHSLEDYVLIDLQRVFRPRLRRSRWRVKDLAALAWSTPPAVVGRLGRLRFLVRYARECPSAGDVRRLARDIDARLVRMQRRSGKSNAVSVSAGATQAIAVL